MLLNLLLAPAKVAKAAAAAVEASAGTAVMGDDGELEDGCIGALWVRPPTTRAPPGAYPAVLHLRTDRICIRTPSCTPSRI